MNTRPDARRPPPLRPRDAARLSTVLLFAVLPFVVALGASGCAPPWVVLQRAEPNRMTPASEFYFSPIRVGPGAAHPNADVKTVTTIANDVGAGIAFGAQGSEYVRVAASPAGAYTVDVELVDVTLPGREGGRVRPLRIEARVDVRDPGGQRVEQFDTWFSLGGTTAAEFEACARSVGVRIAWYLHRRTGQ